MNKIKAKLYIHTLRYMKWSQVYYRIRKIAGFGCNMNRSVKSENGTIHPIRCVRELDFDPVFLSRFAADDLMDDRISFMHSDADMDWNGDWVLKDKSPLWNYNLHYFEYLFPLLKEYFNKSDSKYLKKAVHMINCWIQRNPRNTKSIGWAPYTIDVRLANWLSFYSIAEKDLDTDFRQKMIASIWEQYKHLSKNIEKDILGNHYFEDLKTLVLCAVFFEDRKMLDNVYNAFLKECREEILDDGMHFELSPMYHKIVLEGLIKAYTALKDYGFAVSELEPFIKKMLDAAWSMEESLNRIPLFNDCGNNVAKSLAALVAAAETNLGIQPDYRNRFTDAGFYIFKNNDWKLIIDAGQPGPTYIPGHAHCDALSFELYKNGEPIITNCGTYAYQSDLRDSFRNTSAHNTVMINGLEQSQCWGTFRMAKRSKINVIEADDNHLTAEIRDYTGQKSRRTFHIDDKLTVSDESYGNTLTGFIHPVKDIPIEYRCGTKETIRQMYAPDYGYYVGINAEAYTGKDKIEVIIQLS